MSAVQTLPAQLAAVARLLMKRPDATTTGLWPRAAALLARQSLEEGLDMLWALRAPGMQDATTSAQLVSLPSFVDPELAHRVSYSWWALSAACHHHAFELAPTAEELDHWIAVAENLTAAVNEIAVGGAG